ncbi:MAG: hypothetical protein AMXMBFR33_47810 [Candidatus Xenobia bacterium]
MTEEQLIYDWNRQSGGGELTHSPEVLDVTLLEAPHSPAARQPALSERLRLLHQLDELGLDLACLGDAGEGWAETLPLVSEVVESRLKVRPAVVCQSHASELERVAEACEQLGHAIHVLLQCGYSPLQDWKGEAWTAARAERMQESIMFAVGLGLNVTLLCPDAPRAHPAWLVDTLGRALDSGAQRLALVDTTGCATPEGVARLMAFVAELCRRKAAPQRIDWFGFNDRGLALANALTALESGASRVHASVLGLAERSGCVPLDLLLINLRLLGALDRPMEALASVCQRVAETYQVEVLSNYPVLGKDAFRTGTGVHAAAIIKAERKGFSWLADLIYSGVPAALFGFEQLIEVGPMAGESNVLHWLGRNGLEATPERVQALLAAAKSADHVLSDEEIRVALGETASV